MPTTSRVRRSARPQKVYLCKHKAQGSPKPFSHPRGGPGILLSGHAYHPGWQPGEVKLPGQDLGKRLTTQALFSFYFSLFSFLTLFPFYLFCTYAAANDDALICCMCWGCASDYEHTAICIYILQAESHGAPRILGQVFDVRWSSNQALFPHVNKWRCRELLQNLLNVFFCRM